MGELLILRFGARILVPLFLVYSLYIMLRGHNDAGGGFSGGLIAATALILYGLAYDVRSMKNLLKVHPVRVFGFGLLMASSAAVMPLFVGSTALTGMWIDFEFLHTHIHLGTPMLFDLGVFHCVVGGVMAIIVTLKEY
ncbi:MAG: Na(+)/H(+) antiporter subunit B [Verrucomicrobia bacterium]|nr:Na(+)/H(+) antiporter subunit B [Verrucomicrobiota bacterium]